MQCRECGDAIEADHRFCNHCGAAVIHESAESAPTHSIEPEPADTADAAPTDSKAADSEAVGPVTSEVPAIDSIWSVAPAVPIPPEGESAGECPTEPVDVTPGPADIPSVDPTPIDDIRDRPTELSDAEMDRQSQIDPDPTVEEAAVDTPLVHESPADQSIVDESTQLLPLIQDDSGDWDHDPVWAATGSVPVQEAAAAAYDPVVTEDLPSTEPITEVWMDPVFDPDAHHAIPDATPYDAAAESDSVSTATTSEVAEVGPTTTAQMPAVQFGTAQPRQRFAFTPVTLIAIVTALITLIAVFATVLSITSTERIIPNDDTPEAFRTGTWIIDDLANNLSIASLIAAVMMVVGGIAAGYGWRWGSGLAGGSGLAFAGIGALVIGLAQIPIDAARELALIPNEQQFTLTITRDLGYWMIVVAGALGVILFFASIGDAMSDRRPGLNPWIAAVGGLASLVAVAGPLLPENLAVFSDNWYLVEGPGEAPAILLTTRLVQLGLIAVTGVIGFLMVRRYGLGLAIGGTVPSIWLVASTLFELTDNPVGPGFRNPGATDMHIHGVTIIGISAVAAMAVLAVIGAYDQGIRERP